MCYSEIELKNTKAERRLSLRVQQYWLDRCIGARFPRLTEIDGRDLGEDWENCFLLDAQSQHPFPMFSYLGPELAKYSGVLLSGSRDWQSTLLDKVTTGVGKVIESRRPVTFEEELTRYDGARIRFRSVMLPISDDQVEITHVFGAANGRLIEQG